MSLLRPGVSLKKDRRVGTEFVYDLAAGAAGRAGHALVVGHNDGADIDLGSKLRNRRKNCRAFGAVGHAVRSILDIAPRENFAIREEDGGAHAKF